MEYPSLSEAQEKAAKVLADTSSPQKAAEEAGVPLKDVQAWRRLPHFLDAIRDISSQRLYETVRELQAAGPDAVRILVEEMRSDAQPDTRKIRAATNILQKIKEFSDYVDFLPRLRELERKAVPHDFGVPHYQELPEHLSEPVEVEVLPVVPPE